MRTTVTMKNVMMRIAVMKIAVTMRKIATMMARPLKLLMV